MKKKGFTLIELLAVIIILAVLALIAVPAVSSLVANSKKKTFSNSVNGMIQAVEIYSTKVAGDNITIDLNPTSTDYGKLTYNGKDPELGTAFISADGDILVFMCNSEFCGYRKKNQKTVTVIKRNSEEAQDILTNDIVSWLQN